MNVRDGVVQPEPLAYFLTWATYGTWLPGDERGWVKRRRGHQSARPKLDEFTASRLNEAVCLLDADQRRLVEASVGEHCRIRGWELLAVNCRTNHLHLAVSATHKPKEVVRQIKFWTTRRLNELARQRGSELPGSVPGRQRWWGAGGSQRFLNDSDSLEAAIL